MGPLLFMASALLVATTPPALCYLPSDQTAGWKWVELPDEAPALAAPADLEQFRAGERALLSEQDPRDVYLGASKRHAGRMAYSFRIPKGTFRVGLQFLESLDGAKVDATAYVGARAYPLLREKRHSSELLSLEWDVAGVDTLVVEVHHHLRGEPVVRHWRMDRSVFPSQEQVVPAGFRIARALYFRHPGGRRIELCNAPSQPLVIARWPEGAPSFVTISNNPQMSSQGSDVTAP